MYVRMDGLRVRKVIATHPISPSLKEPSFSASFSIPTKLIYPLIAVNYLFQVSYFGANTRPAINVLPTRVLVAFGAFKLSIQEITARLDAPFVFYGGRREA